MTRRPGAALATALFLLAAMPARAQVPAAKPPPSAPEPPGLGDIPGPNCTIRQIPVFNAAMVEARIRVAAALRLVREEPDNPHVRRWFGDAPHRVVLAALQRTAMRLANTAGFDIRCNDQARCGPGIGAYAETRENILVDRHGQPAASYRTDDGQVMGVCPPFFRARMTGTGTRWGILVHEATHIAAATRDHVYGETGGQALARENGARAAENADNYRYFVETLPRP